VALSTSSGWRTTPEPGSCESRCSLSSNNRWADSLLVLPFSAIATVRCLFIESSGHPVLLTRVPVCFRPIQFNGELEPPCFADGGAKLMVPSLAHRHMESGLAVVFMSDIPGAQQTLTLPQAIKDQCQALGVSATGNAGGKMSVTDLGNAPKGPQDQEHILGW
jgi:hypothetical protein